MDGPSLFIKNSNTKKYMNQALNLKAQLQEKNISKYNTNYLKRVEKKPSDTIIKSLNYN